MRASLAWAGAAYVVVVAYAREARIDNILACMLYHTQLDDHSPVGMESPTSPTQRVNHFRNHYELTRKDLTIKNLRGGPNGRGAAVSSETYEKDAGEGKAREGESREGSDGEGKGGKGGG